ncbi:MAG TPA: hypothetical protein PKB02_17170 [Anaerohalosphaeraceae bacterium]|nr:hypothetical protein [Anaerohalosphaeraceae bacterium]
MRAGMGIDGHGGGVKNTRRQEYKNTACGARGGRATVKLRLAVPHTAGMAIGGGFGFLGKWFKT